MQMQKPPPSMWLVSDRTQVVRDLRQRFVALPDPETPTGWLLDLRDPFHPVIHRYDTWSAAEDAANTAIADCLRAQFGDA